MNINELFPLLSEDKRKYISGFGFKISCDRGDFKSLNELRCELYITLKDFKLEKANGNVFNLNWETIIPLYITNDNGIPTLDLDFVRVFSDTEEYIKGSGTVYGQSRGYTYFSNIEKEFNCELEKILEGIDKAEANALFLSTLRSYLRSQKASLQQALTNAQRLLEIV